MIIVTHLPHLIPTISPSPTIKPIKPTTPNFRKPPQTPIQHIAQVRGVGPNGHTKHYIIYNNIIYNIIYHTSPIHTFPLSFRPYSVHTFPYPPPASIVHTFPGSPKFSVMGLMGLVGFGQGPVGVCAYPPRLPGNTFKPYPRRPGATASPKPPSSCHPTVFPTRPTPTDAARPRTTPRACHALPMPTFNPYHIALNHTPYIRYPHKILPPTTKNILTSPIHNPTIQPYLAPQGTHHEIPSHNHNPPRPYPTPGAA